MALPSIVVADFTGEIRISKDPYDATDAQDYIDEKYPELLRGIIGDYAYSEILAQVSLSQKWDDLLNGVTYTDSSGVTKISDGLVKALKYWLWFFLIRESDWKNTTTGNVNNNNENSSRLSAGTVSVLGATRYNKGCNIVSSAYCFLLEFWYKETDIISQTDNTDNTYTFDVDDNQYLAVDDLIEVDGMELTVTAVIANASITADAGQVGLTFIGPIKWEPFEKYKMPLPYPEKSSSI